MSNISIQMILFIFLPPSGLYAGKFA
jgi:hypothetical protein